MKYYIPRREFKDHLCFDHVKRKKHRLWTFLKKTDLYFETETRRDIKSNTHIILTEQFGPFYDFR